MKKLMIIGVAMCTLFQPVWAAVTETAPDGTILTIPDAQEAQRVGNAVMFKVEWNRGLRLQGKKLILLACDGSWISIIDSSLTIKGELVFNFSDNVLLDKIVMSPISAAPVSGAAILAKRAGQLCKTKRNEPRNFLVPVAESNDKESDYTSFGIVLGTASRKGDIVELWIRQTSYTIRPMLGQDGKPLEINNIVQTQKVATGKYIMVREIFDCRGRKLGVYETSEYSGINSTPKLWSMPANQIKLTNVIPNSIGDALVDTVCAIYGIQ